MEQLKVRHSCESLTIPSSPSPFTYWRRNRGDRERPSQEALKVINNLIINAPPCKAYNGIILSTFILLVSVAVAFPPGEEERPSQEALCKITETMRRRAKWKIFMKIIPSIIVGKCLCLSSIPLCSHPPTSVQSCGRDSTMESDALFRLARTLSPESLATGGRSS
jgi:hypothetical protein